MFTWAKILMFPLMWFSCRCPWPCVFKCILSGSNLWNLALVKRGQMLKYLWDMHMIIWSQPSGFSSGRTRCDTQICGGLQLIESPIKEKMWIKNPSQSCWRSLRMTELEVLSVIEKLPIPNLFPWVICQTQEMPKLSHALLR